MRSSTPKKRGNNRKKMEAFTKRARRGMLGFTITWQDSDPFSENGKIDGGDIDHANPTQRLICREMWDKFKPWIVTNEFTWQVIMRVIFVGAPKGDCHYDFDCTFTCALQGKKSDILNDQLAIFLKEAKAGNDHYKDGDANKGVYARCEFLAVIIGI